ncbi:MAG: hypothetical protein K0R28_2385 [Paenibacillus sp.]|nr:hypothetical protein [Paenibacillus sp.]
MRVLNGNKKIDPQATGRGSSSIYMKKGVEVYYRARTLKESENNISVMLQMSALYGLSGNQALQPRHFCLKNRY